MPYATTRSRSSTVQSVALYGSYNESPTGPSRVTTGFAEGLAARGIDVELITAGTGRTHPDDRITVTNVPIDGGSVVGFWRIHRWVKSYVKERLASLDVFHAVSGFSYPADVTTVQGTFTDIDLLRTAPDALPSLRAFLGANVYSLLKTNGIYRSRQVVTTSPVSTRQLRGYLHTREDEMIPLGIDRATLRDPTPVERPVSVLFVGRIEPRKGQSRALTHLDPSADEYTVDIVGPVADETYAAQFQSDWESRIHGRVSDSELEEFYDAADIVVMPSHHETFGLVGLEAVARGCAVVTTDTTGFGLLSRSSSDTGVFVQSNGAAVADCVRRLCRDPQLDEYKRAARRFADSFTWDRIMGRYEAIYRELL